MRKIRYRAFYQGKMYQVLELNFEGFDDALRNILLNNGDRLWVGKDTFELMEYSDTQDINKLDIYEGDVVIQYETPKNRYIKNQEVFFINGTFVVGIKGDTETPLYFETNSTYREKNCNLIEVIGNIYENKELITPSQSPQ